ncbi:peptidase M23 [Bacterioplanes sanyensis]|uniref:Peptidase M23 n=1 Tax=Bacterioplanes sanyensis TaxID=1249553 RepID=A0A222FMB0_9GAMM|nr:M23 family metallopeptidase [Bacterioplanes sanyensis]ASP40158.1 peptidase M23 [Bacterioplanes sanyensis]
MDSYVNKKLLAVGISVGQCVLALHAYAVDIHSFDVSAPKRMAIGSEPLALSRVQELSVAQFVDVPRSEPLVWSVYLQQHAPQWLPYADVLSHWAGTASINPQLVVALLEANGQQISASSSTLRPLWGALPEQALGSELDAQTAEPAENAISEIIAEQLLTLASYFYLYDEQPEARAATSSAASWALWQSFAQAELNADQHLRAVVEAYQRLFPKAFSTRLAPMTVQAAATPPPDLLQWPWRQGYYWKANGAHANSGSGYPLSSVDVSYDWPRWGGRTYSVTAAHSGQVQVYSRCNLRITHPSGWQTNYYHMEDIEVSSGDWVDINTRIGTYANDRNTALCQGGSSTGPHLHFSLLYNGRYQSLQGVNLGPYVVNVGNYSYDDNCRRYWLYHQDEQRSYCAWDWLYNSGPKQ